LSHPGEPYITSLCHLVEEWKNHLPKGHGDSILWYDAQRNWGVFGWYDYEVQERRKSCSCFLKKLFEKLRKYKPRLNPAKCSFGVKSRKLLGFMESDKGIEVGPDKVKII